MEVLMETGAHPERRKARRTANACISCRQSKIKCSGDEPCQNCKRRAIQCHFADGGNKVMVSEKSVASPLRLQKQAEENLRSPSINNLESPTQTGDQNRSPAARPPAPGSLPAQPYSSPPVSRVYTRDETSPRQRRSTDTSFSFSGEINNERGADTTLVSPAPTIEAPRRPETGAGSTTTPAYQETDPPLQVWSNPFKMPSKIIRNTCKDKRAWIWLAPWSTWSFTMRLMLMLGERLHPEDPSIPLNIIDPHVYALAWKTSSSDLPDLSGLPSLDYAIYLFNTVKFHLGQNYRLFNEEELENQIRDFYSNALQKAVECRLWFVKFLLILAFGTAFQALPTDTQEPAGAKFFIRAMALLPDPTSLWKDSLLAIEVLALLGHAIRIAQMEGLHTELPEDELGTETITCCRDLWWTLYIMDRHFSSSIGLPMSVQDSDITTPVNPPSIGSQGDSFRSLQCVIIATRPLLLSVLKERLDILGYPGDENCESFLAQTGTVISTGIKSAAKTLQILTSEYSLLEAFLPYDVEFTFGAALHLTMANALFPGVVDYQGCRESAHQILDDLSLRGNRVAQARRSELCYLENLYQELVAQVQQQGHQMLHLFSDEGTAAELMRKVNQEHDRLLVVENETGAITAALEPGHQLHYMHPHVMSNMEFLDNIGISSEEFLSIVQEIGDPENLPESMLTLV
ncbi:hypothetical protein AAE478_007485 [Parahypoxylon ruwenzoriense]